MLLRNIVETSRKVGETRSRLAKIGELAQTIRDFATDELEAGVAMLAGEVRQGRIGIGWAKLADLPAPAAEPTLGVLELDETLTRFASTSGKGSSRDRDRLLGALLQRATADEQLFLRRLLLGELRQGALEGIVLDAIAKAANLPAADIRRAVMLAGNAAHVARVALTEGASGLSRFSIQLFRPLQPMLAQTAEDVADALHLIERPALEYKLDGARIQVHRAGDDVRVYSRQLNDVTTSVPEVVDAIRALPVREIVLDGEAIALKPDGRPQPFQVTMTRFGRKLNIDKLRAELPLTPFLFDCIWLDGKSLLDDPNSERIATLEHIAPQGLRIPRVLPAGPDDAQRFAERALASGHEGVVAKSLTAPYEAGRRGASWLKIKPTHTLDLVVLAVERGSGRRSQWLSNLHLGARDPKAGTFVMLGKTFKGMTDEMLAWQTEKLTSLAIGQEGHITHVRPELVVEIAFDGVQASPHYPAKMALRFARVKRYRPDKTALEADTIDTVRRIFEGQTLRLDAQL